MSLNFVGVALPGLAAVTGAPVLDVLGYSLVALGVVNQPPDRYASLRKAGSHRAQLDNRDAVTQVRMHGGECFRSSTRDDRRAAGAVTAEDASALSGRGASSLPNGK